MVLIAQGLAVGLVVVLPTLPQGNDVVDYLPCCDLACLIALHTERVLAQPLGPPIYCRPAPQTVRLKGLRHQALGVQGAEPGLQGGELQWAVIRITRFTIC